jgi:hypothetical protein
MVLPVQYKYCSTVPRNFLAMHGTNAATPPDLLYIMNLRHSDFPGIYLFAHLGSLPQEEAIEKAEQHGGRCARVYVPGWV